MKTRGYQIEKRTDAEEAGEEDEEEKDGRESEDQLSVSEEPHDIIF